MEIELIFLILSSLVAFSIGLYISHIIYNSIVFLKIKKVHGNSATQFLNSLITDRLKFNDGEVEKYAFASTFWSIVWYILFILTYGIIFTIIIGLQLISIIYFIPILLISLILIATIFFAVKVNINNIKGVRTNLDFYIFKLPIFIDFDFSFFYFKPGGKLLPLGYIPPFTWVDKNKSYSKYLSLINRFEKFLYIIPYILCLLLIPYISVFLAIIGIVGGNYYFLILIPAAIYLWALQVVQIRESTLNEFTAKYPNLSKGVAYIVVFSFLGFVGTMVVVLIIFFIWLIYQAMYLSLNPADSHYADRWFIYIMAITFPLIFFWDKIKKNLKK